MILLKKKLFVCLFLIELWDNSVFLVIIRLKIKRTNQKRVETSKLTCLTRSSKVDATNFPLNNRQTILNVKIMDFFINNLSGLVRNRKSKIDNQKKTNNNKMHQNRKTKRGSVNHIIRVCKWKFLKLLQ